MFLLNIMSIWKFNGRNKLSNYWIIIIRHLVLKQNFPSQSSIILKLISRSKKKNYNPQYIELYVYSYFVLDITT